MNYNLQFFGGRGSSGSRGGAGSKTTVKLSEKEMLSSVSVNAKWNGIERKVVYGISFQSEDGSHHLDRGILSKGAVKEIAKELGATSGQMKEISGQLRKIDPKVYRR